MVGAVGGGLWDSMTSVTSGIVNAGAAASQQAKEAALKAASEAKRASDVPVKLAALHDLKMLVRPLCSASRCVCVCVCVCGFMHACMHA